MADENGARKRKNFEIDFVINKGAERVYIQSAYQMPTVEKVVQEQNSLLNVKDSFKKLIIVWDDIKQKVDDNGIVTVGLLDFLLGEYVL
ncbi:MAG: ATP-binding protein [Paludibacteraceae bacterium]|nr:ATP-binding protein [Paludibacteraceae bacterium]